MSDLTCRVIIALSAATVIACSHSNPAAPAELPAATSSATTAPLMAPFADHTLVSVPLVSTFGVNATGIKSVRLFFGFPDVPIFDVVLHGHTHRMLVAGPSTPGFDTIAARLTDQVDDVMSFRSLLLPNGVGDGPDETTLQSILLPGVNLQGASIKRIRLKIEDFSIVSPGSDPNGDGMWTDYRFAATLFIEQ